MKECRRCGEKIDDLDLLCRDCQKKQDYEEQCEAEAEAESQQYDDEILCGSDDE
jgi:predicted amidophosphoribosyltransferase